VQTAQETGETVVIATVAVVRRMVMRRGVRDSLQCGLDPIIIGPLGGLRNTEKVSPPLPSLPLLTSPLPSLFYLTLLFTSLYFLPLLHFSVARKELMILTFIIV
jgi:hypothetical protein